MEGLSYDDDGNAVPLAAERARRRRSLEDPFIGWTATLSITLLGLFLRLWKLGTPHAFEFDETYYAKDAWSLWHFGYARDYIDNDGGVANKHILGGQTTGLWKPDASMVVHPEVGKWLIGLGEKTFGFTPLGWRVVPAIVGTLLILVMIRFVRRLTGSTLLGCVAGLLVCFDGLEFVLSRLALLDIFVAFFVLCAVHCLVLDRDWYRAKMASLVPGQISDPGDWGPVKALLFRPWLLVSGICWGLACGSKWEAAYPLAAFSLLAVAWCAGARRSFGVSWSGVRALVADAPARVRPPRARRLRRLRRHLDRLADALQPVRRVPLRQPVHPLRLGRLRLREAHHVRQLQALADGRPAGQARDPGPRAGPRLADALPPRRLRLPHPLPDRVHPHLRLAAARLAAAQPARRGRRADRDQARHRRLRRPRRQRLPAPGAAARNPALWWGGVLAILYAVVMWVGRRDWRFGVAVVGAASTWLPWFLYDGRPIFSFYSIVTLPFLVLAITLALGRLLGTSREPTPRRTVGVVIAGSYVVLVMLNFAWFWPIYTDGLLTHAEWLQRIWFSRWI